MLNTAPTFAMPDNVYEMLVEAHRDLTPEQSRLVNAKLILLLANHIGDADILAEAIARARRLAPPLGKFLTPLLGQRGAVRTEALRDRSQNADLAPTQVESS